MSRRGRASRCDGVHVRISHPRRGRRPGPGSVDLDGPLADSPTRTVLYDPEQPRRALLLEELPAWVRVTPDGVWEAGDDPKAAGRMALLALCWFGGLPLGWISGLIMRATI